MAVRVASVVLLAPACSDYALKEYDPDLPGMDASAIFRPDTAESLAEPTCTDEADLPAGVDVVESCVATPVVSTLTTTVEWATTTLGDLPEYAHVLMAPVVGPLRDLDGDGDVDADDPPCIAIVADDGGGDGQSTRGVLRVLDGRDGTPLGSVALLTEDDAQIFPYRYSNLALGDLDHDGVPEIVAVVTVNEGPPGDPGGSGEDTGPPDDGGGDTGGGGIVVRPGAPLPPPAEGPCRVAAFTPELALKWLAEEPALTCGGHAPALADLEGDGTVEVIVGAALFEGATGAWRGSGSAGGGRPLGFPEAGWMSFAVDLDGDGVQEVVSGDAVYAPDATTRCTTGYPDGFPAAADLDGDGVGELVVAASGVLRVFDASCALRSEVALVGAGIGGPPSVGDLDADGLPEIGVASAEAYAVFEADGTLRWSVPTSDASSSTTGAAFYDFDGDGGLEVVYADETALWILDGATGTVRLQDDSHSSRTLHELPVIVDVDGDGATEIVVPNGGAHTDDPAVGLYVLGSADGSWTTNRRVWNQHAYAIVNVDDDLGIPRAPASSWPTWNTFRSGTIDPVGGGALPDAVPVFEVCDPACETGRLLVDVAVGNGGMSPLRAGVPVTLYVDGAPVETARTSAVVAPGEMSEPLRFEVWPGREVRVVVDDDGRGFGRVVECSETNNAGVEPGCP